MDRESDEKRNEEQKGDSKQDYTKKTSTKQRKVLINF
jgi:hypothetical protein